MHNKEKVSMYWKLTDYKGQRFTNPLVANLKDITEFLIYNSHPVVLL